MSWSIIDYMKHAYARRQIFALIAAAFVACLVLISQQGEFTQSSVLSSELEQQYFGDQSALEVLDRLPVKGRAPKTGYARSQFGNGWTKEGGMCDTRNIILSRDLTDVVVDDQCRVQSGQLIDPYTGVIVDFVRGSTTSSLVQIDHVVALSDAWQKGAQQLSTDERVKLANDPLNLLAVAGAANQQKSDGDAATWLPENKSFRCQYVARQVAVKHKYYLWVTEAEKATIAGILNKCTE